VSKTPLSELKNLSEKDRAQLEQVEELLGPDAETMGFAKGVFWGRIPEDLVFPYPEVSPDENARLQKVLEELDDYLEKEHPHVEVDLQQKVPDWCIRRLFETGVMGMAVPEKYGGGGLKFSSYVRAIERIGRTCASTAVLVSAHESMCCCGLGLFGTPEQKRQYLPLLASERLGAFCLSILSQLSCLHKMAA
jgi:alkylation response protein AidB-like acyl-CoA dehydrogenase